MAFKKKVLWLLIVTFIVHFSSCAKLNQLSKIQKPSVQVTQVRFAGLNFDGIDLVFDIEVKNPNSLGINLSEFDYDLKINGNKFLSGSNPKGLRIAANGYELINFPVSLKFKEIYNTFSGIQKEDSSQYEINLGFAFNLPIIGDVRVPLTHSGNFPNIKLPTVNVEGLKIAKLNLTGAELELKLAVSNPNFFGINLNKLNYNFAVNNNTWGSGIAEQLQTVREKNTGIVRIPLQLNFLEMGMSIYNLLTNNQPLDYQLSAQLDVGTTLAILKGTTINIHQAGTLNVER